MEKPDFEKIATDWAEKNGLVNAGVLVNDGSHWRKLTNTLIAGMERIWEDYVVPLQAKVNHQASSIEEHGLEFEDMKYKRDDLRAQVEALTKERDTATASFERIQQEKQDWYKENSKHCEALEKALGEIKLELPPSPASDRIREIANAALSQEPKQP